MEAYEAVAVIIVQRGERALLLDYGTAKAPDREFIPLSTLSPESRDWLTANPRANKGTLDVAQWKLREIGWL